jgi:hypothetical protein
MEKYECGCCLGKELVTKQDKVIFVFWIKDINGYKACEVCHKKPAKAVISDKRKAA